MAQIIIRYEGCDSTVQLTGDCTIVGRSAKSHVALKDASLSREHCRLTRREDGYYIEDLGSRNGTFVNGENIGSSSARKLQAGDMIEIGSVIIIFERPTPGRSYEPMASKGKPPPQLHQVGTQPTIICLEPGSATGEVQNFISWKPRSVDVRYVVVVLALAAYVVAIAVLLFYKPRRADMTEAATGGLLGKDGAFELDTELGKCPASWVCSDETAAKVVAAHCKSGERSLLVERTVSKLQLSRCTFARKFDVKQGCRYRFSGWVLGASPAMPAGVLYSWFLKREDTVPLDETLVMVDEFGEEWTRLPAVAVSPPPLAGALAISLVLDGEEGRAYFDELRLEETEAEDTLHLRAARGGFSIFAGPTGAFSAFREPNSLLAGISFFAEKAGDVALQAIHGSGSWVTSPRDGAEPVFTFAGELANPAGLQNLIVRTSIDSVPDGVEARFTVQGERADELDAAGIVFRFPSVLATKSVVVVRGATEEVVRRKSEFSGVDFLRLGVGKQALVVGFSSPVAMRFRQAGEVWECWCRIHATSSSFASFFEPDHGLVVVVSSGKEEPSEGTVPAGATGLQEAVNAEAAGRLGEALAAYRKLAAEKDRQLSEDERVLIAQRTTVLEERAGTELERLQNSAKSSQLFFDVKALGVVRDGLDEFVRRFEGTEYAERARTLLTAVEAAILDIQHNLQRTEVERLLRMAQGYMKEGKTTIARTCCEEVIARFPDSEWAQQAKIMLDQLEPE